MLTGSPQRDWSPMVNLDRPALIRLWIAQAYAHGALFMIPYHQWAPEGSGGWYYPDFSDFDYIYNFIHDNADLFDGYTLSAKASFLLVYKGLRYGKSKTNTTIKFLVENNIPFNIIPIGDDWWENEPIDEDFIKTDAILTNSDIDYLEAGQKEFLDKYAYKVTDYDDLFTLFKFVHRPFDISVSNEYITVVPRENKDNTESPYVYHLINRLYDANVNGMRVQNFSITIDTSEYEEKIGGAKLLRPGKDPIDLQLISAPYGFSINITNLAEWGIIQFEIGEPDYINSAEFTRADNILTFYPNPAKDYFFVNVAEQSVLQAYSLNGTLLFEQECKPGNNKVNLEKLSSGIYFIRINNGNSIQTGKLVVTH